MIHFPNNNNPEEILSDVVLAIFYFIFLLNFYLGRYSHYLEMPDKTWWSYGATYRGYSVATEQLFVLIVILYKYSWTLKFNLKW